MRIWFSGPRILHGPVRPGISLGREDWNPRLPSYRRYFARNHWPSQCHAVGSHSEVTLMTTAYRNFHAPINPLTAQRFMAACGNVITQGHDELYLCISTPGGQIASGITLYNFLRSMPIKVITHNIGSVDSIGNAIFLAGELRRACSHSTFMFHGTAFDMLTQAHLEQKNLREMLNSLLADEQRIADILVERTKITPDQAGQLFAEAKTKNADDAFRLGIIHEISDLAIPAGTPILTLVFN